MEIELTVDAIKDLQEWKQSGNSSVLKRIKALLNSIRETPYEGIGKPEALKYQLFGLWSRRINQEDRLVYEIKGEIVIVYSLKGHYKKN
jgi:toxin YoeB